MKLSEIILIGIVFFFVFGLALGSCIAGGPPPKVLLDVDVSIQQAIEEEAPVLPDDFAKNDPPRVSAQWMELIPPEVVKDDGKAGQKIATLFTSDGTWKCKACNVQAGYISASQPKFAYQTVKVPAQGQSPTGLVPYWVAPDGTGFEGYMDTKALEKWIAEHTPKEGTEVSKDAGEEITIGEEIKGLQIVKIDGSSSSAVVAAILDNVARTELMKAGKLSPSGAVASTWLPEININLDDPILKILDGLLSKDGMTLGGGKISWPAGKRVVIFDPPIDVSYRKILEVSATVKAVEVNGREVVVRMGGRLVPDLKVILMSRAAFRRFIWSPDASKPFDVKLAADRVLPDRISGRPVVWVDSVEIPNVVSFGIL